MLSCSFTADATQQSSELSLGLGFETAAPIAPLFSGPWLRDYVKGRGPGAIRCHIAEREHRDRLTEMVLCTVSKSRVHGWSSVSKEAVRRL